MQKISQLILLSLGIGMGLALGKRLRQDHDETMPDAPLPRNDEGYEASPVPDPATVARTYGKLPSVVRKHIAGMIRDKDKVKNQTVTPATGWLYACICERIDRKRNRLEASLAEMEESTGMNADTIIRHTQILEELGLLEVDRRRDNATRNDVNVYHIAGAGKHVVLWIGTGSIRESQSDDPSQSGRASESLLNDSFKHHVGGESTTPSIKESFSHGSSENAQADEFPVPAICERIEMDSVVAARLINQHGIERVTATCTEASKKRGLNNPAGWAVKRIVDPAYVPAPVEENNPVSFTSDDENFDAWLKQRADRDAAHEAEQKRIAPLREIRMGEKSAWDVWEIAVKQLEWQRVRVQGMTLLAVVDGKFQIGVQNPRQIHPRHLERMLWDVAGQPVQVEIVGLEAVV